MSKILSSLNVMLENGNDDNDDEYYNVAYLLYSFIVIKFNFSAYVW